MMDDEEEEGPKNPIYLFIKYSILVICILATAFRIYQNYKTYCEYKLLINSKVQLSENEILPQLSICFYEIVNEQKLNESMLVDYHRMMNDPSKYSYWAAEKFSNKHLFDYSFDFDDYFVNCTFLDTSAIHNQNCTNFYTVTLSTKKKCFNFFHRDWIEDENKEKWIYNRILLQNRPWVRIFVKKQILIHKKKMDIIINPYFSIPNVDKSNPGFKSFTTDYTQSIYVSYDCRKSKRLPKPYETQCVNYTDIGYFDRQHCVYECRIVNILNRNGGWTDDLMMNQTLAEQIDRLNISLDTKEQDKSSVGTDCEKKCQYLDCEDKEYTIINKYHKLDVETITSEIEVRLYLNSAPTNYLEYEELYPLGSSFVSMFIGPASLWLGLSIYSLSKLMFWFLCELTNRKAKQKDKSKNADTENLDKKNLSFDTNRLSSLNNSDKFHSYLNNYNTNYRSFAFDNNNNPIKGLYNVKTDFQIKSSDNLLAMPDTRLNRSIDNYYNQLNRISTTKLINNVAQHDLKNNDVYAITNSPAFRTKLEIYPKNEINKSNIGQSKVLAKENSRTNLLPVTNMANESGEETSWISKLIKQKNKLINYLSKNTQKVHPNLNNR